MMRLPELRRSERVVFVKMNFRNSMVLLFTWQQFCRSGRAFRRRRPPTISQTNVGAASFSTRLPGDAAPVAPSFSIASRRRAAS